VGVVREGLLKGKEGRCDVACLQTVSTAGVASNYIGVDKMHKCWLIVIL
jgi:hypothetical protein